jgi:NAD(P)-dependent dehydrogenase (short-subunit alcohol dehydrogenase family)
MPLTWFITGTSSGFGRLLIERLLARGDRVAATLRRPESLDDLRTKYDDRLWIARLDVTDTGQVHSVVNDAFKVLGTIDVVVNNAGYGVFASVEEAADEQIRRGIEGFCETAAKEIAPFGIGLTIVEPGATPTGFGSALDAAPPMPEYAGTPADDVRRAVADGTLSLPNDPQKIAEAIISLVDSGATPLRLPLGSDAYDDIRAALVARLAEHEAHRDVAFSVVRDEPR